MVTVLIDVLLAFWVLAFGAMAIVPLVLGGSGKRHAQPIAAEPAGTAPAAALEDQVLSILPSRPVRPGRPIDRLPARDDRPAVEPRRAA